METQADGGRRKLRRKTGISYNKCPGLRLMVTKSKLKKADPQNRAACKTGNSVVGGGSAPTLL